jgi:hypothetical protein
MSHSLPGKGFFGWLGRQVGYVKKATETDPGGPKTVFRNNRVEEQEMPDQPGVKLRRTVIDEVIVDTKPKLEQTTRNPKTKNAE